jgi:hypothetical integral membrane protein (TIGR02206 family)
VEARPFVLFGLDHIAAILTTGLVAAALSLAVRRNPDGALGKTVRIGFAGVIAAAIVVGMVQDGLRGRLSVWDWVPLNLCDFEIVLAVFALLTRRQAAYEIFYFWALAGTLFAMITPDLERGFPSRQFLSFFAFHGAVVTAALFMTWGLKMRPRAGAHWRAFLWTNVYAAVAAAVNLIFQKNYLYLCEKPRGFSVLDWFGPWPYYILATEALALALFHLLSLPFRDRRQPTRTRS